MGPSKVEQPQLSSERLVRDRINYDHEMLRLMFAHLRHQMQLQLHLHLQDEEDEEKYATMYIINQVNVYIILMYT